MSDAIAIAAIVVAVLAAIFAAAWLGQRSGKAAAKHETWEKIDEEVEKANSARAAVRPDDADGMRADPYNRDNRL